MKYDVVVVGGGAGGLAVALALRSLRPDLRILIVRRTKLQPVPCSVPYIPETIGSIEGCLIPDAMVKNAGIDLVVDEVVEIDRAKKLVKTAGGREFEYGKLVLATGAGPVKLNIPGIDLEGVVLVYKEYEQLAKTLEFLKSAKRIVIVGGGFVGLEFADDLAKGREVHVVEVLDEVLALAFDREFGEIARKKLEERGVRFHLNASVKEIRGKGRVEEVVLSTGEAVPAEAVLISVGVRPNSELAAKAGLTLDESGHVVVDAYMRTSDPDIYAVGDVAQKRDYFTGKPVKTYFSSIAVAEGRIAAMHITGTTPGKGFEGALPAFSTVVGGTAFAAAGLTEAAARKLGLDVIPVKVETVNRHPANLPGAAKITLKALFSKGDLKLVGVQMAGPEAVGEAINYAAAVIQQNLTAHDIVKMNFATQPLLTASPLAYPLQLAALQAIATASKQR
jgi:NADPH-dependent 2,4-dienoyl-CoA reductase/sulfur reductase-like enzyme